MLKTDLKLDKIEKNKDMTEKFTIKLKKLIKRLFMNKLLLKSTVMLVFSALMVVVTVFAWFFIPNASVDQEYKTIDQGDFDISFFIDGEKIDPSKRFSLIDAIPGKAYEVKVIIDNKREASGVFYNIAIGGAEGYLAGDYNNEKEDFEMEPDDDVLKFFSISDDIVAKSYKKEDAEENKTINGENKNRTFSTIYDVLTEKSKLIGTYTPVEQMSTIIFYIRVNEEDPNEEINDINRFQGCEIVIKNLTLSIKGS